MTNIIEQINKEFDEIALNQGFTEVWAEDSYTDIKQFLNDAIRRVLKEAKKDVEFRDVLLTGHSIDFGNKNRTKELLKEINKEDDKH